jgi:DNA uptake protein ComE-like DNA-binding protein
MSSRLSSRTKLSLLIGGVLISMLMFKCSRHYLGQAQEEADDYASKCHGRPLGSPEQRDQAMQDGYEILRGYDCISKQSYDQMAEYRAEAARNPRPARAGDEAKKAATMARPDVLTPEPAFGGASGRKQHAKQVPPVDANTAGRVELTDVTGLDSALVEQILDRRSEGQFKDWDDLLQRVAGMRVANRAALVSAGGLRVHGQSYVGKPSDPAPVGLSATLKTN